MQRTLSGNQSLTTSTPGKKHPPDSPLPAKRGPPHLHTTIEILLKPTKASTRPPWHLHNSSSIAHNTKVLCEHNASPSSKTSSLLSVILPKLSHTTSEHKTLDVDPYFAHYHTLSPSSFPPAQASAGGLTFLVVADKNLGQRIPFGFLATIEKRFFEEFEAASTDFAALPSFGCAGFNGTMRRLMEEQGGTESGQRDALRTAQREIDGVREIMTENIERVLERGERIDLLVDQTDRLGSSARDFRVRSRGLKRRMWWKNVKLMVLLALVVVFLVYLFVGFGCGLPAWGRCLHH
ncbi:unnamed protein product [Periconia digitata]|uniref:Synaptobrevin homolog YKT6 n=1 Tax=Periconia digitata TaxID=1303443 RepID=A0A9W4XJ70_9PLEO|nr:unnamed protein product [Periconia digitata]